MTPMQTLAGAALFSGIGPVLVRASPVGPAATGFWRCAIALPFAWWSGRHSLFLPRRDIGLALVSGVLLALDLVFWNTSILRTSVMEATVLVMTFPLIVAAGEVLLLGRRLRANLIIGALIAFTGTIIIALGQARAHSDLIGNGMAVLAAFLYAGSLFISAELCRRNDVRGVTFWLILGAMAGTLPVALTEAAPFPLNLHDFGYLGFYGLITYGSYALYNMALSKLPTTLVAISGYAQPVIASTLAAIFLNEIPTPASIAGGLVIIGGLLVATWRRQ